MTPRLNSSNRPAKRKFSFLVAVAILLNCFVPASFAATRALSRESLQAQTDSIRQYSLTTNDLVYNKADQTLYASVPSSAGAGGNSIVSITPATGAVGSPVFIGSEPNKLALSDDGKTLYAALDGAYAVRRFDLTTKTPGQKFDLGRDTIYNNLYTANDLAVAPGSPNVVAVAKRGAYSTAAVGVFDNGVQRTKTGGDSTSLAFSASASKLYGNSSYSGLRTMTVDSSGVTVDSTTTSFYINGQIKFDNGVLYSSTGQVINPETRTLLGTFSGASANTFVTDSSAGLAFYLTGDNYSSTNTMTLRAFDINTFLSAGTITIPGVTGQATSLVRWGANGLAFRTTGNQLFIIQTSLIPSAEPVPTPTPTPTPSPTPTPTPTTPATFVRRVNLSVNDIVYNPTTQMIYASVPSNAGTGGNSITPINPATGATGSSVFVGSEPNRLALSDNGQTLYVNLDGANAARRFDIPSLTPGLQFATSFTQRPTEMKVMPGSPQTLAISNGGSLLIFDDGVRRTNAGSINGLFEFGASPTVIYGPTYSGFAKMTLDSTGVKTTTTASGFNVGTGELKFVNGLLYSASGVVSDPEALTISGTFQGGGNALAVDAANGRVFIASYNYSSSGLTLKAFDINTFLPLGSVTFPNITGTPARLYRWGANGLALSMVPSSGSTAQNPVYLFQTSLVSSATSVPTGIQTSADSYSVYESNGTLSIPVQRTGDVSSTTTVDYATSNGTATAGSDYTATSGTLTFAPGEVTKNISIPITYDNLYEGANETFNLTLSNPSGGALLTTTSALITITDNSSKPPISVPYSLRVAETNSGTTNAALTVTLSNPSVQTVTVDYTTADGTAQAGSDYVATSGTLTIPAGATSATINVPINGDTLAEPDETFLFKISNATNVGYVSTAQTTVTIADDDTPPDLSVSQVATPSPATVGGNVRYTVTIRNNSTTVANSVVLTDNLPAATTFVSCSASSGGTCAGTGNTQIVSFQNLAAQSSVTVNITAKVNDSTADGTVIKNTATVNYALTDPVPDNNSSTLDVTVNAPVMQFNAATYTVNEGAGSAAVTVTRSGNSASAATVNYASSDTAGLNNCGLANGIASSRCDYATVVGTLQFAAGESSKVINMPIVDDAYVEGPENLTITLSNATGGVLGQQTTATLTITDNDATAGNNPIPGTAFFVRQQYIDFLGREPDPAGYAAWQNILSNCAAGDITCDRIAVSSGFFRSPEFQDRGYFVYRFYSTALGRIPHYSEFMPDLAKVSGFLNAQQLEANKVAFVNEFMSRQEFQNKYGSLTDPTAYVDALLQTVGLPNHPSRSAWITSLSNNAMTKAQVLRSLSESVEVYNKYYTESFVVMQYFGYLRRDPDALYQEWIRIMNENGGDYRSMISGFMNSNEYVLRFGL